MTYGPRVPLSSGSPGYLKMGSKTALCGSTWPYVALLGPYVPQDGPTWANLGQLSANLGPTWGQLGAPEAKSDCIFTVFFKVCVKIEFSLPRAAQEAPRDAQEAPGAGQERSEVAQHRSKRGPRATMGGPRAAQERPRNSPRGARSGPRGQRRPQRLPGGSTWAKFSQLGDNFPATGRHFQNCPVGKAYASIRPVQLDVLVKLLHVDLVRRRTADQ